MSLPQLLPEKKTPEPFPFKRLHCLILLLWEKDGRPSPSDLQRYLKAIGGFYILTQFLLAIVTAIARIRLAVRRWVVRHAP